MENKFQIGQFYVVNAYDNFSTDKLEEKECIMQVSGIAIKEDNNYIYLKHITADLFDEKSSKEYHVIYKPALTSIKKLTENENN